MARVKLTSKGFRATSQLVGLFFCGIVLGTSCSSNRIQVNPGAYVTVDGTDDGLEHIQRDFESASRTDAGILVVFESDVLFAINSSYLSEEAKKELDKFYTHIADRPAKTLLVEGHTDATGTAEYNLWLSEKRAESVKEYLVNLGLSASQIQTKGLGQTQPVASNSTTEGRLKNRRVTITIMD